MELIVHRHAEADLDRLFETNEEAVAYIDNIIELIGSNGVLFDKLLDEKYFREYDPPTGLLGVEAKRVGILWRQDIRVMRLRFDEEAAATFRLLYAARTERQPNGTYKRTVCILAVADKESDKFNYQPDHPIIERIRHDYPKLRT